MPKLSKNVIRIIAIICSVALLGSVAVSIAFGIYGLL